MPAFEPSTWAEVEEALISGKAPVENESSFAEKVRVFTNAPERSSLHSKQDEPVGLYTSSGGFLVSDKEDSRPPNDPGLEKGKNPIRAPLSNIRGGEGHFEDPLGKGRIEIGAEGAAAKKQDSAVKSSENDKTGESTNGDTACSKTINPSSECFNVEMYLARVHQTSSLEELARGQEALAGLKGRYDAESEILRKEEYVNAALVEAAFQNAKRSAPVRSSKTEPPKLENPSEVFANVEELLRTRYADIIRREATLTRLRRTLGVYTRYQWVFSLGNRLRSSTTESPNAMEEAIREYQRGLKWIEAQEDSNLVSIETDINDGFTFLVESIFTQLSTKNLSQKQTSRFVSILTGVKKENMLIKALSVRTQHAIDELEGLYDVFDIPTESRFSIEKLQKEAFARISRGSSIFLEGLVHIWQLGRIIRLQEKWRDVIDGDVLKCCEAYAGVVRKTFADKSVPLSQEAVRELGSVHAKAKDDLHVPLSCLVPITTVTRDITQRFLRAICESVRNKTEDLVTEATQCHSKIGSSIAARLASILSEAFDELEDSLAHKHDVFGDSNKTEFSPEKAKADKDTDLSVESSSTEVFSVTQVAITCAQAPGTFAQRVYDYLPREDLDNEILALQLSACCVELNSCALESVRRRTGPNSGVDAEIIANYISESETVLQNFLTETTTIYISLVAAPLEILVADLISLSEEEYEESGRPTVPIKIEGISEGANEIALQLTLTAIAIRQKTQNTKLIRAILLSLIQDIGNALVEALSVDKLVYHRAAQLWVDVTYIQDTITRGADVETSGLQKALDGYAKVKERAAQAVLADGYSFSLTDMDDLKETVIATGVARSQMVQDCFRETWALVQEATNNDD